MKNKLLKIIVFLILTLIFTIIFSSIIKTNATEDLKTLNMIIEENNKKEIKYLIEDTYIYEDENILNPKYLIQKGQEIEIIKVSEKISQIFYKNSTYYMSNIFLSENKEPIEINKELFVKENCIAYKNPTIDTTEKIILSKWEKIFINYEINEFYNILYNGESYYIKKDFFVNYSDMFTDCEKDIIVLNDIYTYFDTSCYIKDIFIKKGTKLRILKENNDLLVLEYNDRHTYIKNNSEDVILATKIFTKSNDYVVTTENTKVYLQMNENNDFFCEIPENTILQRTYYGNKGYDIINFNNCLVYIKKDSIVPKSNIIVETRKIGYLKENSSIYLNKELKEECFQLQSGTRLYIIDETNGISKVSDGTNKGYIKTELVVDLLEAFFATNEIKYAKEDIVFTYIKDNKEYSEIIPKGIFIKVIENSHMGLSRIIYDNKEGIVKSDLLIDKPIISSTEKFMSYKSDTIEVKINRYNENGCVYWISEIIVNDASKQFICGLSYDDYGGKREKTTETVLRNNGIIGINGSGFWYEDGTIFGNIVIKNSEVIKDGYGENHLMCVDKNGKIFSAPDPSSATDLLKLGVTNTFGFGPMLIINGKSVYDYDTGAYPRTAIGMIEPGHYIIITADGKRAKTYSKGLSIKKLANLFHEYNVEYAYNLDGGGSVTLTFLGELINIPSDGSERPCADTIYFIE